jgi:hypothetical protein
VLVFALTFFNQVDKRLDGNDKYHIDNSHLLRSIKPNFRSCGFLI